MPLAIIAHGGAWDIPGELHDEHLDGCRAAVAAGWELLTRGSTALQAVEAAVRVMEDSGIFDAGRGSHLNADGVVEMDAGIMDGATLAAGAVAAVKRIANPITLARHVLAESPHLLLVGEGAERFAQTAGMALSDPQALIAPRERILWEQKGRATEPIPLDAFFRTHASDTVGAIALDGAGNLAVANSTGGTFFKHPGRVGDTPIVGAGFYADNAAGAAACTGWGEQIMQTVLARATVDRIAQLGSAGAAAQAAIAYFRRRVDGLGGVICMTPNGEIGFAHSTPYLAHAYRAEYTDDIVVGMTAE